MELSRTLNGQKDDVTASLASPNSKDQPVDGGSAHFQDYLSSRPTFVVILTLHDCFSFRPNFRFMFVGLTQDADRMLAKNATKPSVTPSV